ncbi:hypothetical protein H2198_004358 [Neophaeococcomyces mojaviensis]|uniref:Uncharacterized protein n=1 Tax=Neophaeococcomyces mojaviensis TaxID=3383035 RepID=A0ACC3A8P7_9EURO|nr:hypothetical protein H2198_004358 [Knufia sp. JES_112]
MENDQRPYQAVRVDLVGIEKGLDRFTKDGSTHLPPVSRWRNNLTALSQHGNLFFVASDDCVAVYQPEFPYQTLRRQPVLLIQPNLENRYARGFMSSRRDGVEAHCINQLMIGDLGSQEILLLATDSGNVVAYYTVDVVKAIDCAPEPSPEQSASHLTSLRPFFRHWVRQSAWGLDIHKEARMIAVSANTPSRAQPALTEDPSATVTVFAFGLSKGSDHDDSNGDSDSNVEEDEWAEWHAHPDAKEPKRDRNYKVVLAGMNGHGNNIPNISFVNTTEDHEGTWLLSTDITGTMKLWRIWKGTCFRSWYFGDQENSVGPFLHAHYPGWAVAALDVNSFRPTNTDHEFIGASRAPVYHGHHDRGPSFSLTNVIRRHIPGYSHYHPTHPDAVIEDSTAEEDQIHNGDGDDESDIEEDLMEDIQSLAPISVPDFDVNFAFDNQYSQPRNMIQDVEAFGEVRYTLETDFSSDDDTEEDEREGEDDFMDDDESQSSLTSNPRMRQVIARKVTPIQSNVKVPVIAMLHCGDAHIRMLSGPRARFPHLFCANILRQRIPADLVQTNIQALEFIHMDRLNMLHKIPELGVVLVATQTGRVAVLALTRRHDGILGFRVDWVLPTKRQETRGLRPNLCALIGMAIGPVQGRWLPEFSKSDNDDRPHPQDGLIDGVWTSFDPDMVTLRCSPTPSEKKAWKNGDGPDPKVEHRSWRKTPGEIPSWRAIENSRRYRIMLTYSDMSVLTYEIWRDVENSDKP